MTKNGLTQFKIDDLKCDVNELKNDMRAVLENHLPHLSEDMASLKTRINVLSIVNVGAIIVGIILAKYL